MNLTIPANLPQDKVEAIQKIINSATEMSDEEIVKPHPSGVAKGCDLRFGTAVHYTFHPTYEEADANFDQETRRRKCKLVMKRLNGDWKPEWTKPGQGKFSLMVSAGALRSAEFVYAYNEWAFKDRATADRFIRLCGDDIKVLWGIA